MNTNDTIILKPIGIPEIKGRFRIPNYQRGYRWQRRQVDQLLEDIHANKDNKSYYLQPIVVIKSKDENYDYDLIDGQQRLTTLFLIYKALEEFLADPSNRKTEDVIEIQFSLGYETRSGSEAFINDISIKSGEEAKSNPDYLYMWHAYQKIKSWLNVNIVRAHEFLQTLNEKVRVIWYQIPLSEEDAYKIFANLNSGKIPLRNSELVKALFLCEFQNGVKEQTLDYYQKVSMVEAWDSIERELSEPAFWSFLTTEEMSKYPTRIDLILDIISNKSNEERNNYFTFAYYEKEFRSDHGQEKWQELLDAYLKICDWYQDNEIFHHIGYLITVQEKSMLEIFQKCKNLPESKVKEQLVQWIKDSLQGIKQVSKLRYGNKHDEPLIRKLLILINVEALLILKDNSMRYPFHLHEESRKKNGGWSLEHIHAQNSQDLPEKERHLWLKLHLASLARFESLCDKTYLRRRHDVESKENAEQKETKLVILDSQYKDLKENIEGLRLRMDALQKSDKIEAKDLREIMKDFGEITRPPFENLKNNQDEEFYRDEIRNMALLTCRHNSIINNSCYDVKRSIILNEMEDEFIPPFTQRVFAKTIPNCDLEQLYFWSDDDRKAYLAQIEKTLGAFLPETL